MINSIPTRSLVSCERRFVQTDGGRRSFITVRGHQQVPSPALVIMLHGTMQTAANIRPFAGYAFDHLAVGGEVVVIYPDALRRDWNGARKAVMVSKKTKSVDDVGFIRAVIEHAVAVEDVDPARVYVAGFSLGGQMTLRLLHEIPELLAGAAVLGATMPAPENFTIDRDARLALPVLMVHGTADPVAPFNGGLVGFRGHFAKGMHLSAPDTARYFAARNGIAAAPAATELPHRLDLGKPTAVTRYEYTAAGAAPVRLYAVGGGGHVLPNPNHVPAQWFWGPTTRDIAVADVIAEFFDFSTTPQGAS